LSVSNKEYDDDDDDDVSSRKNYMCSFLCVIYHHYAMF